MLTSYFTADSANTVRYTVAGAHLFDKVQARIVDVKELAHGPVRLRIDRVFFALEKDLRGFLCWEDSEESLIFPLQDRGLFDFESSFGGWSNPMRAGATGNILLRVIGPVDDLQRHFALKLELTKQS